MSIRLRLGDFRASRGPQALGYCATDPRIPSVVSTAQTRLINCREAGEEGWLGSWAEMAFTVNKCSPHLTTPREVARLEVVTVCDRPIPVQNQFYEYLRFGNGRMPRNFPCVGPFLTQAYSRNIVPTFVDIGATPQFIQIFASDPADITNAKRVMLQGTDQNGITVRSLDGNPPVQVQGELNVLTSPFTVSPTTWATITGIQKDVTLGQVQFFKVDPATGESTLILTMDPSEQVAAYRRYFFHPVPRSCCPASGAVPQNVAVKAIVKLDPMPLVADSDYLLLQGEGALEAIIEEGQSVRYSTMDTPTAKQLSRERHNAAIEFLNGTLTNYLGKNTPAINFLPFGSARLERLKIAMT